MFFTPPKDSTGQDARAARVGVTTDDWRGFADDYRDFGDAAVMKRAWE
jgi:hypothetical protein